MAEKVIVAEGICFAYGKTVAVDGISFDVSEGEILGFLGPNGAGKSTTIKMLTGMLSPQDGRVSLFGLDHRSGRDSIRSRMGGCFEEKNLYPEMSAKENLEFFARLFGIKRFDAGAVLERVGLSDRMNERVKRYSKGMRQRLMMARALVNRPDVLFLDEPTDGLDPVSSRAIRGIIKEEAERGTAVLLTTHDMNEADSLSDRVAFINEGRIVALDTPEELKIRHGTRTVRVRSRVNGEVVERIVALESDDAGERLKQEVSEPGLLTIHTEEASLEEIFIELTGRGLI
jgi:ABC-type multidrug transport system ATPase subunit